MNDETNEVDEVGESGKASKTTTTGAAAGQPSLGATMRRILEMAELDRERGVPGPLVGEGGADQSRRSVETVIALIEAMEANEATALRGRDIRALRKAVHMSARELAKRLGYTESAIYDWETERHCCPPSRYLSLLDAILGWREEQEHWMALISKDLRAHRR